MTAPTGLPLFLISGLSLLVKLKLDKKMHHAISFRAIAFITSQIHGSPIVDVRMLLPSDLEWDLWAYPKVLQFPKVVIE